MSPLVENIDKGDAFERIFGQEKLSLVLFTNKKKAFLKEFKAFARSENKRFQKKITYVVANYNMDIGKRLARFAKLKPEDGLPQIAIMHPKSGNISFDFLKPEGNEQRVTASRLFKFVRDWRATTLVDHIVT